MSRTLDVGRIDRIVLLSLMMMTVPSFAIAQRAKKSSRIATPSISNTTVQPQLLNADTNPTLRFPIARASLSVTSLSYGWLDITRAGIHYTVEQPPKKQADGFSASAADIRDLKLDERNNTVVFRDGKKREMLFYSSRENWGSIRRSRDFYAQATEGASGTQSIYKTMLDFEAMLALVKSTAAPPAPAVVAPVVPVSPPSTPAAPLGPPAIVVASPSGAGENRTVELSESPLVIRGVAMDSTGMPIVKINGLPANMRPQNSQAAEFWSDPLPLKPGANPILITASNSAHVETNVAFTVRYTPKAAPVNQRGLDKAEIISLLQGAVPASRVAEIVKERGIKFAPTADDLNDIRAAGGSDELIEAIQQAAPPK
ncbi:MAG: hypothetical protein P4N24_03185 [Acidobacteriota bacterium]|nr:hypothetical protein [Acidobacteriota bacterium]